MSPTFEGLYSVWTWFDSHITFFSERLMKLINNNLQMPNQGFETQTAALLQ